MSMYDAMNREQVKCFPLTTYYNPDKEEGCHLSFIGGYLRIFTNGSKVPWYSYNYNYGKDFMIIDTHFREFAYRCPICMEDYYKDEYENPGICPDCNVKLEHSPCLIHIIRNGKVKKTITRFEDLKDIDFKETKKCISYYGAELNIHNLNELKLFIEDLRIYRKKFEPLFEITNKLLSEMNKLVHNKNKTEAEKNRYKEVLSQYEVEDEKRSQEINKLKELYINKWYNYDFSLEKDLGSYLHLLKKYEFDENEKEKFILIKKEFCSFINANPDIIQSYSDYFNIEDMTETLKTIEYYKK